MVIYKYFVAIALYSVASVSLLHASNTGVSLELSRIKDIDDTIQRVNNINRVYKLIYPINR